MENLKPLRKYFGNSMLILFAVIYVICSIFGIPYYDSHFSKLYFKIFENIMIAIIIFEVVLLIIQVIDFKRKK